MGRKLPRRCSGDWRLTKWKELICRWAKEEGVPVAGEGCRKQPAVSLAEAAVVEKAQEIGKNGLAPICGPFDLV